MESTEDKVPISESAIIFSLNDKEEIDRKIASSFQEWKDKAKMIDDVKIGKKTDVSEIPQDDWVKNADG